jgi:hypothetical protein
LTRRLRGRARHGVVMDMHACLPPLPPVIALISMPFLPFVNTPGLWFGLPRMIVWSALWVILLTPAMVWSARLIDRRDEERS